MRTKNGQKVTAIVRGDRRIFGLVKGKPLSWDTNGRRTSTRRSKLDLDLGKFLVIRKWGSRYSVKEVSEPPQSGNSIVKIVQL